MKQKEKAVKVASYTAGVLVIAAAMLLAVLLVVSAIGLIHPRKVPITLYTADASKTYDGLPLMGSAPVILSGALHNGHTIECRYIPSYSDVGEHENAPEYAILDETGDDVTDYYDITFVAGSLRISPRRIRLFCQSEWKVYDGEPLLSDDVVLNSGSLVEGDTLITMGGNSQTLPGEIDCRPAYRILSSDGVDVTDQYAITEEFGTLRVDPIELVIKTAGASKMYDGTPLSAGNWRLIEGNLLTGHHLHIQMTASIDDVGQIENIGIPSVTDQIGKDFSHLYRVKFQSGILSILPMPLYITTEGMKKVYDGTPIRCEKWALTQGKVAAGETLHANGFASLDRVGSLDNVINFFVIDADGRDVTYRYDFHCEYGTLNMQPKAITIRTGSAEKIFDGMPLYCDTFELVKGSLCKGDEIELVCSSISYIGFSQNLVLDCTIYRRDENGNQTDVTACYRISFDYGVLRITAAS